MRTLELEVNWLYYALLLALIWLGNLVANVLGVPASLLQVVTITCSIITLATFIFSVTGKRFLHIDKAGLSYKFFGETQYLHSEHLQTIKLVDLGLVSIPVIYLDDGRVIRFYSWKMTRDELTKAESLVS